MEEQCNCKCCRARMEDEDKNNAPIECGVNCDCITINGEKLCKKGRMGVEIDGLDKRATLLPPHEAPQFFPYSMNFKDKLGNIFHVEAVHAENNCKEIVIRIMSLDENVTKLTKVLVNPSESFKDVMFSFIEVVDEYRPNRIFFDINGLGIGFKEGFEEIVNKPYIALSIDNDGSIVYHK